MYPLLKVAVMLVLGIIAGEWWIGVLSVYVWLAVAAALAVLALLTSRLPTVNSALIGLLVFATGGCLIVRSEDALQVRLPGVTTYEAVLMTEPVEHGKVVRMDIGVLTASRPLMVKASLLRDTVEERYRELHVGDGIEASSLLEKPTTAEGAEFDYALWLHRHGFDAATFIYYKNWKRKPVRLSSFSLVERATLRLRRFRSVLEARLKQNGMRGQDLAVVSAMTLGDRRLVSKEVKDDYSVSGASHVLALSGLHLGIIYGILGFFFSVCKGFVPLSGGFRKAISEFLIMTAVWSYVFLVGFSPSIVRSAIMLTVCSVVSLLHRDRYSVNTLAFAALLILSANPLALFDVGFQLSFAAVLSILLFMPLIYPAVPAAWLQRHWLLKWLWGMAVVSFSAQLGTAPLVACHFGRFPCYGLLASFIAIPCATVVVYGVLFFFAVSPVPFLAAWIGKGIAAVSGLMNQSLSWTASLPGASMEQLHVSSVQAAVCYVVLFGVWLSGRFFMERMDLR